MFHFTSSDCPVLTPPNDGSISTTAVIPGTLVIVSCDSDFILSGDSVLECQTDGSWNSSVGMCDKGS